MTKRIRPKLKSNTYDAKKLRIARNNNKNLFDSIKKETVIRMNHNER